ncbi:MAG: ARPP-1 family domain-containing protein [Actinomycetota bacterium]
MTTTVLRQTAIGRPITKRGVAIFPVYRPGSSSGEVALARPGDGFVVREKATPTVPILEVDNTGATPVVLFAGETLEGGHQQRVLNQSVIIPGHTVTDIPVSCVEQGRWHGDRRFNGVGEMAPPAIRRSANVSDQGAVWSHVDQLLAAHRLRSDTSALDEYFRSRPASHDTELIDEISSWGPLPEQTGVIVMNRGEVVSLDIFADQSMLASMWATLIGSAFASEVAAGSSPSNRVDKAFNFLRRFTRELRGPLGRSDFGLGEWRQVITDKVTGQALALDGALVHASAFPSGL